MANVQNYFIQFDDAIRLERDDEKAILCEKRERILLRLSEGITRQRKEGKVIPSYEAFNQGSYAMNTGVKPIDGDFDIDVGLRFDLSTADYPDPLVVKKWVHDALENHTRKVQIRRSCVTVFYQAEGEDIYHVDLAIYSSAERNRDHRDFIAKGKPSTPPADRSWEISDQQELHDRIVRRQSGADAEQLRRVIRALKRWKDVRFARQRNAAPTGLALTVAAYHWFVPFRKTDPGAKTGSYDDLEALRLLVGTMLSGFRTVWSEAEQKHTKRLRIDLPTHPHTDLCAQMSDSRMRELEQRLEGLHGALQQAQDVVDPHEACQELRKHFGDDFPVPDRSSKP